MGTKVCSGMEMNVGFGAVVVVAVLPVLESGLSVILGMRGMTGTNLLGVVIFESVIFGLV